MPFRLKTTLFSSLTVSDVDRWNGLDQCVIDSVTVNTFENGYGESDKTRWASSRTNSVRLQVPATSFMRLWHACDNRLVAYLRELNY